MTTLYGAVSGTGGGGVPIDNTGPGYLSWANPQVQASMQQYNADKAALSNPQTVGLLMQQGLSGLASALGMSQSQPLQGYANQSGYPVGSVVDGGGGYGGGNITQNTQYVQPNTQISNVQNVAQTQFTPAQQEMMQMPDLMSMGQASPDMIAYQMAQQGLTGQGPQLSGYAMGADALPMSPAPGMSPGESRGPAGGDMGAQPPAPGQPSAGPAQQAPPPMAPPGQLPPSAATAALQGAPPPAAPPAQYAGPLEYDPAGKAPGMKGYKDPQTGAPGQSPQAGPNQGATPGTISPRPNPNQPRPMNPLDAMLMMMSPKLAKQVTENNKARAAAEAAIRMKYLDYDMDMKKQEYIADRTYKLEMDKKDLDAKAAKHLNAAQLATVMDKFMDDEPGGAKRTALADQFPELLPYLNDPQSKEASLKFRGEGLDQLSKAIQNKIDMTTIDSQINKIVADGHKAGYDSQDAYLKTQFDKDTYADRVAQESNQSKKGKQDVDQASLKNPLEIQKMAMDHVMDIQKYGMNESSEARAAQGSALAYMKQLTDMAVNLPKTDPNKAAAQQALQTMNYAMSATGKPEFDKKTKMPIPPKGDVTLAGGLTHNAIGTTLNAGRKPNGLIPPPPAMAAAPSLAPNAGVPWDLAGVVNQAGLKYSKDGLAQAPRAVPMPPGSNPGLQQVQQAAFQNAQGQPAPQSAPQPQPAPPRPNVAPQGAPLSTVQQSINAGRWVGDAEPTAAERLQMLPHIMGQAFNKAVGGGLAGAPKAIGQAMDAQSQRAWEGEKKAILNPFLTPESRGLKKGVPLTDPDLVSYFARKAQTNDRYKELVKAAGWTPVLSMEEMREKAHPTPITNKTMVLQAFNSGMSELLSPAQREWASLENREASRQNFVNRYSGSEPGNRRPSQPVPVQVARR